MEERINRLLLRFNEVEEALASPQVYNDQKLYKQMTQEHAYLSKINEVWYQIKSTEKSLQDNRDLLFEEKDAEMQLLLKEEIPLLQSRLEKCQAALETLLVPPDPTDSRPIIMELRAGTGGDEAALFVGDCIRMYQLYADKQGWRYELLSCSPSEIGGYKEYIMVLSGTNVKRLLQYEAGTHRVQRVPDTETQGRIHTSAITVAVLLEPTEEEEIEIKESELRVDTYRASGAGGQHVNTTDSAVRVTHLPTGLVAYCQEERSQIKNKDKALRLLKAKLSDAQRVEREAETASTRASQIGSGDRSERIRTYNFAQNRVTDHRIGLTLYQLDYILQGDLDSLTVPLVAYFYQERLSKG